MSTLTSIIKKIFSNKNRQQQKSPSIPRIIHIIWIGDEKLIPIGNIETWSQLNPDFEIKTWGNDELKSRPWRNADAMKLFWDKELCAVADLMRYEILYDEGGVYVDADSTCIRPLDDVLMENTSFACWENELERPGLISNGFLGFPPGSKLLKNLIDDINSDKKDNDAPAWQATGPVKLTNAFLRTRDTTLTIFPSHYFLPRYFTGLQYTGSGRSYSNHNWDSTHHRQLLKSEARPTCPRLTNL